jgi:hypothetical protein
MLLPLSATGVGKCADSFTTGFATAQAIGNWALLARFLPSTSREKWRLDRVRRRDDCRCAAAALRRARPRKRGETRSSHGKARVMHRNKATLRLVALRCGSYASLQFLRAEHAVDGTAPGPQRLGRIVTLISQGKSAG